MREKFYEYLMNGLNDYDRKYLPMMDYVLMLFLKEKLKRILLKKAMFILLNIHQANMNIIVLWRYLRKKWA